MSLHPHPSSTPPGLRLRRALLSISRQAERDLEQMASGDAQTRIHSLRVRMKKLRAILRLLEPGVSASSMKVIQSDMRALKKAFAMNRDQHVLNALLAEFCNGNTASSHSDYLAPEMGDFSNGPPEPARLRKLQAAARELTNRLQNMTIRPLEWSDVAQAYAKRYAKARKGLRRCEQKPSPARLHRWRSPVNLKTGMEVSGHGCPAEWLLG